MNLAARRDKGPVFVEIFGGCLLDMRTQGKKKDASFVVINEIA